MSLTSNPSETPPPPPPPLSTSGVVTEDRTVAILAYVTIIGFIIAIVIHSSKKTALGAFHLRQVLGLIVSGFVAWVACVVLAFIPILGWLCIIAIWVGFFVMWLMGLIAAASGQQKPMPILGAKYQQWFGGAFN
jgi:uncharacterized membrane protein